MRVALSNSLLKFALPAALAAVVAGILPADALAQKQGGILRVSHRDSPVSLSILEELTISSEAERGLSRLPSVSAGVSAQ